MMTIQKIQEELYWLRVRIEAFEGQSPLPLDAARSLRTLHANQRAALRELACLQYHGAMINSAREVGALVLNPNAAA